MLFKAKLDRFNFVNIAQRLALGLVGLFWVAAIASWSTPSSAQSSVSPSSSRFAFGQPSPRVFAVGDIEFASVQLDGVALFQVAAQKSSPSDSEPTGSLSAIQRRVQRIESNLHNLVDSGFDPQTLDVRPSTLNNLTVIIASDQKHLAQQVILTVNEMDVLLNPAILTDLAEQWSEIIHQALLLAHQERQPEARRRQLATGVGIVLGLIILSFLHFWSQKWLKKRFNILKKRAIAQASSGSSPLLLNEPIHKPLNEPLNEPINGTDRFFQEPLAVLSAFRQQANLQERLTLNLLLQRFDQVGLILLWFGGAAAIVYVFPETRFATRSFLVIPLRIFVIWLILTLIGNLAILYVNHKLREWVEQAAVVSENPERRILRAPTLLLVSRGIIGFASVCVGIIWFLAWNRVFPSSLLTGAGLVGAGLTFAFRDLFKDWIMGILIILEDQYAVGDMIEFEALIGTVENMSLRATQLRTADGRLSTISHNQITTAHNLTKDWSRVNFTIEVAYDTDPNVAIASMKQVAQTMAQESPWQDDILDPVNAIGVNRVTHSGIEIMMRIQVKRLRQWDVEREFRRRLKLAFDEQRIQIGVPKQHFLFPENPSQP